MERRREGVRLTEAGRIVLRRATAALDEIDRTARELSGMPDEGGTVRVGWLPSAGAVVLPRAMEAVRASHVVVRPVRGGAREQRRLLLARLPGPPREAVERVAEALRAAVLETETLPRPRGDRWA
ncbi:hypothetical protein [Streptomyces jumonjinensis]|uniref:hypothetical protein n=1 Tax=Streptomyces jumonjinensis TaxID=1945 RepID=UPI0037A46B4C